MKKEEVIEWLTIIKANLNSFPEVSNAKKIEALGEAIRFIKNEESIDKIDCNHTECRNCTNHKYCDYEISSSENPNKSENPTSSDDCISRKAVLKIYDEWFSTCNIADKKESPKAKINALSSVTPIRPKGHWIWELDETPSTPISPYELNYAGWVCSCCHEFPDDICEWDNPDEPPTYKFCPNCGSDNREVVE